MNHYSIYIKPLKNEQASVSCFWRNDPEVWKFTGKRPDKEITQEIEQEWLEKVLKEPNSKRFGIWAGEKYIGNVQLTGIIEGQAAEYHIFIGEKDFWGKGIAKLATLQILRFARHDLKLNEVFLKVNVHHHSAIKLYKSCGFCEQGEENGWLNMKINFSESDFAPKLSVFMMTYNHGLFLKEALDGILEQQCAFDFEIVIGDDFSTDNTRSIIDQYSMEYPGKFKFLLHAKNIGAYQNQNAVFEACEGEFVALCEGDDYWDDPYKLQKQVDFLETHPGYVLSFHEVEKIDPSGKPLDQAVLGKVRWKDLSREQLIAGDLVPSVSAVFRGKHLKEFLSIQAEVKNGDTFLFAILGQYGKAHFHSDIKPAKYRIHGGGVWSGSNAKSRIESQIVTFEVLSKVIQQKFLSLVNRVLLEKYLTQITKYDYQKLLKAKQYFSLWRFAFLTRQSILLFKIHFYFLVNKSKLNRG